MASKTLSVEIKATDGASATFEKVGNAAESMGKSLEKASKSGGGFSDWVTKNTTGIHALGGVMAGVGGVLTAAFVAPMALGTKAAWAQVDAVQKATVALRGYEKDASKVNKVLSELVQYARSPEGVLFQRQDLFNAAQGLKVAGAETENLTRYVQIMSRAVAQGMTDWGELTQVLQRVGATGKITGDDFDNLTKAGFQLDESLRNQKISWDELFSALDQGIPGMGDALNTIEGQSIRLQSAIRELGLAFLGVNRDTSEFIQGGLGDQLYQGLGTAREVLLSMRPAAEAFGSAAAVAAQGAGALASAYLALPQPIQTAITLMGGLTGVTLTAGGALLLMLPRIIATKAAIATLGASFSGLVPALGAAAGALFSPVGILAGLAALALYFDQKNRPQWGTANPMVDSVKAVQDAISDLSIRGGDDLSALATSSGSAFARISSDLERIGELSRKIDTSDANTDPALLAAWNSEIAILLDRYSEFGALAPALGENVSAILHAVGSGASIAQTELGVLLDQFDRGAISPVQFAEGVQKIVESLEDYDIQAEKTAGTIGTISGYAAAHAAGMEKQAEAIDASRKAMHEGQLEFLGDGDRILGWWERYQDELKKTQDGNNALSETQVYLARQIASNPFREMVDWAQDIGQSGAALDQVLRTFQQIDSLGQRSASAGSIAENLVGKPGEWAEIDDMLVRWLEHAQGVEETAAAYDRYNQTVQAGYEIQESNARVQQLLNDIRADQLPLLAEEQLAYEQNLQYLAGLNAQEQRRALMLQDSSVQAQIATMYNTAYAASIGEIPKEVATEMIVEAANADAALKDILLQLGLISEVDGEIRVNFPDADATVSAINRITIAILSLEALASGKTVYEIAVELYGEEEAKDILGYFEDEDGRRHNVEVDVQTTGTGDLETANAQLKEVTLADGTVVTVKTEVDTEGWDQLTAAELSAKFDNDPVQLPVEGVLQPMDGVTPEQWNDMIGPYPEIEIPAKVTPSFDGFAEGFANIPFLGGLAGPPEIKVPVGADTSQFDSELNRVSGTTIDDKTAMILGDNAGAMSAIDATNLRNVDEKTLNILGDNSAAIAAINAVNNMSVYDKSMTINVVTAYSTVGTPSLYAGIRHGGIAGYAHGGMVMAELAEAGPEVLRFANGGTAMVNDRGLYNIPVGTYVSPNNAVGNDVGGIVIHVDFSGAQFNGASRDDMRAWAQEEFIPSLRRVIQDERMGQVS